MSLKSFHLVFICASILLSFIVGAWGLQQYRVAQDGVGLLLAVVFYVTGFGLVGYGLKFVRKVKELGI